MAIIYVRSTDGSDADNGSTWALAKATLAGAGAIDAAGDTIYLSQAHAESTSGTISLGLAGTATAPTKIIGANDSAAPPTAVSVLPTITGTGAGGAMGLNSGAVHWYGINFIGGTAASSYTISLGTTLPSRFERCSFTAIGNTDAEFAVAGGTSTKLLFESCDFKLATTTQLVMTVAGRVDIRGGSVLVGSSAITRGFDFSTLGVLQVEAFDFTNCAAAFDLCKAPASATIPYRARFIDCKLPASWSGSPVTGTPNPGAMVEMINCSAGSTNYAYWRKTHAGEIKHESVIVRSSGASDGVTPLSWKMTSNANALYPYNGLESQEILLWNDNTGSSKTATVEVVTDNVTLTDAEAFIELQYLGSSATPLATRINDAKADFAATAASQTSSSVTWTTTGLTTPVKQKLAVTFTPQMKGYLIARIILCKASTTMYVDPLITIT